MSGLLGEQARALTNTYVSVAYAEQQREPLEAGTKEGGVRRATSLSPAHTAPRLLENRLVNSRFRLSTPAELGKERLRGLLGEFPNWINVTKIAILKNGGLKSKHFWERIKEKAFL